MNGLLSRAELSNVLTDAALQSLFMQPRRADLISEAGGTNFVYGVDANVVRFWGNPRSHEPESHKHLGRIFRGDSIELATAISCGLLNFIFDYLGNADTPLLLIPPIETEVASILEALHDTDHISLSAAAAARIEAVVARVREELPPEQLGSLNAKLQELLFQEIGEQAELRRLLLLFARRRIAKLDDARRFLPEPLREVLLPSEDVLHQWYEYGLAKMGDGREDGWKKRLGHVGSWRREELRDHDADVLARLEVWNRILAEKKINWRVLYITADQRLFRAAATVPAFGDPNGRSFAEAFLRHPRAYLSEDGVLGSIDNELGQEGASAESETVGDWLALLTQPANASFVELLDTPRDALETPETIRVFASQMSDGRRAQGETAEVLATQLLQKWDRFAKGALVANQASNEGLLGLTNDLKRPAEEMFELLRQAHDRLEIDRRDTLQQYLTITTRLGRKFEAGQERKPLLRSVAPIYFENWPDANQAIAVMSHWSDDDIDEEAYQKAIALIGKNDSSSYAFYLGNAAFFAARGRWTSAALVARRARGIHDSKGANGREAAYFEGFCRRHLARQRQALEGSRDCLTAAFAILEMEKEQKIYDEFVEERLLLEAALLDLVAFFFVALVEAPEVPHGAELQEISEIFWSQLNDQWARLGIDGDPVAYGTAGKAAAIALGGTEDARHRVEAQLLITVISLAFVPGSTVREARRARTALEVFERRVALGYINEAGLSSFDRAYLLGARVREQMGQRAREPRREFERVVRLLEGEKERLLPYERPMLAELRRRTATGWLTA